MQHQGVISFPSIECIDEKTGAGLTTAYGLDGRGVGVPVGARFVSSPRPVMVPTHPPIQWVSRAHSLGGKVVGAWGSSLPTTARSRMRGCLHPLWHTSSWGSRGKVVPVLN
jgi:hypothetical protein